jgi:tetratricopeptide repeat protein
MRVERTGTLIVAVGVVILPGAAHPDDIFLKSGGRVSGRVVSRSATSVEVDVGAGRITVPTSSVVRIEEGPSALQEYEERSRRIPAADANAWIALGEWASAQGLSSQAREAYHRALAASPNDPRANAGLGNVQVNGRWVDEDEGYRAKGYVRFEGEWMTPNEHQAILRERAAEAEQERRHREGEQRAREAEARAQEAEARARKAEVEAKEAQEANEGLPLWYGWGVGPTAWPSGPIVTPYRPVPR